MSKTAEILSRCGGSCSSQTRLQIVNLGMQPSSFFKMNLFRQSEPLPQTGKLGGVIQTLFRNRRETLKGSSIFVAKGITFTNHFAQIPRKRTDLGMILGDVALPNDLGEIGLSGARRMRICLLRLRIRTRRPTISAIGSRQMQLCFNPIQFGSGPTQALLRHREGGFSILPTSIQVAISLLRIQDLSTRLRHLRDEMGDGRFQTAAILGQVIDMCLQVTDLAQPTIEIPVEISDLSIQGRDLGPPDLSTLIDAHHLKRFEGADVLTVKIRSFVSSTNGLPEFIAQVQHPVA
ncbi:Hypothetical protein PHPALM_14619 [Phytophthora palmivora]|uniref:Uncharacterized protein n=1 Tax=Phytophthora palmivora TaxID=4796 RepID=A0A2P4XU93_9STRA|nr:Hypothetical protein PHPALM_14619 [Phytophthora palmivora]